MRCFSYLFIESFRCSNCKKRDEFNRMIADCRAGKVPEGTWDKLLFPPVGKQSWKCTAVADMKQIHYFAVLGFEMDCGHAFSEKYGNAANNHDALNRIIDDVTDIPLLGSAIYSRWRYFNQIQTVPSRAAMIKTLCRRTSQILRKRYLTSFVSTVGERYLTHRFMGG